MCMYTQTHTDFAITHLPLNHLHSISCYSTLTSWGYGRKKYKGKNCKRDQITTQHLSENSVLFSGTSDCPTACFWLPKTQLLLQSKVLAVSQIQYEFWGLAWEKWQIKRRLPITETYLQVSGCKIGTTSDSQDNGVRLTTAVVKCSQRNGGCKSLRR